MKKFLMLIMLFGVFAFTACGTESVGENPAPTEKPSVEADAPTEPTQAPVKPDDAVGTENVTDKSESDSADTDTTEPTPVPEPTDAATGAETDFAMVLAAIHSLNTYEEREAYIATLSSAEYKVETTDSFDLLIQSSGEAMKRVVTFDMTTGKNIWSDVPGSELYYPEIDDMTLEACLESEDEEEMPTGEAYLMTITNLATGESDPWGVRIKKTGVEIVEVETDWGMEYIYQMDPESEITEECVTVEQLVNAKNQSNEWNYTHEIQLTIVEPVMPQTQYDEYGEPTGNYCYYRTEYEKVYVDADQVITDWSGDYCYDDAYEYHYVYQDVNDNYYYKKVNEIEIVIDEKENTIAYSEDYGEYLLDAAGNVVTQSFQRMEEASDPDILTWDTLKYYNDIYDPVVLEAFEEILSYDGEYAIADMKAEDYPHLSAEAFRRLINRCMEQYGVELDEEVLAIRASIPEAWGSNYKVYCEKKGSFSIPDIDADGENVFVAVTIDRKPNWYIDNTTATCEIMVQEESICSDEPAYRIVYQSTYEKVGTDAADMEERAIECLFNEAWWLEGDEAVITTSKDGKPLYYIEKIYDDAREFFVAQDVGLSYFVFLSAVTYDMDTPVEKLIEPFLLGDANLQR